MQTERTGNLITFSCSCPVNNVFIITALFKGFVYMYYLKRQKFLIHNA